MGESKLEKAIRAIDDINREDPNIDVLNGIEMPKEILYSQRMTNCLNTHWPNATDVLKIAVHAQHIKRWQLKRSDYEIGKKGYMLWRREQGKLHANLTEQIMDTAGYSKEDSSQVASILRKEKLKSNELAQTMEDVACLVFLEFYFESFAAKHDEHKLIDIVQKTWRKMSEKGHQIALSLSLPNHLNNIVQKALS